MGVVDAAVDQQAVSRLRGDIVNVSSQAGKHGYADVPSYCASKWGLLGFAEALDRAVEAIQQDLEEDSP